MNLSKLLATAGGVALTAAHADALITKADFYVKQVETVANTVADVSLSGPQKLAAVRDAVAADVAATMPTVAPNFWAVWPTLVGVINGLVALYHAAQVFGFDVKPPTSAPAAPPAHIAPPEPAKPGATVSGSQA